MLHITISNERQREQLAHGQGPIEFGRAPSEDGRRFVIEDRYVSRSQLLLEQASDSTVRVENLGQPFTLPSSKTINQGESRVFDLPVQLTVGYTTIGVSSSAAAAPRRDPSLQTIARPIRARRQDEATTTLKALGGSPDPEMLTQWFETVLSVQRSAAGSDAFYDETANAVVELVGLDCGMVIMRRGDDWHIKAIHRRTLDVDGDFSKTVLRQVLDDKRTLFRSPKASEGQASLALVESVVASPIFDADDEIVGVVYGVRSRESVVLRRGISPLEAQVVQLLAGAVSAGLARMEQEANAARIRAQFEQFSSPKVVAELQRNPNLLDGADREITVLFSDIRSFSRISEQLGARDTYRLVGEVMDCLTARILDHDGVVIDYHGDGMAAMWNAPADQPDHADLACRAALAMQQESATLNEHWQELLGMPIAFGVGINTGLAQVGNAGSSRQLKYGPRGHAVNVASRIEGATKHLGVPILITSQTRSKLSLPLETRRLAKLRVVGIEGTVDVFELYGETADPHWLKRREKYEQALTLYESQQSDGASSILEELLRDPVGQADPPSRMLSMVILEKRKSAEGYDPTIELGSK